MTTEPPTSQDPKRLLLFMALSLALIMGTNLVLDRLGLLPEPQPEPPAEAVAQQEAEESPAGEEVQGPDPETTEPSGASESEAAAESTAPEAPAPPDRPSVVKIDPARLVLGATEGQTEDGYHLQVEPSQVGAGLLRVLSSQYNAEYEPGQPRHRPLVLVQRKPSGPLPLSMEVFLEDYPLEQLLNHDGNASPRAGGDLDVRDWQVMVGDVPLDELDEADRKSVQPVRLLRDDQGNEIGQELSFRTTFHHPSDESPVTITKTFRLLKGRDAVEVALRFALPEGAQRDRRLLYRLNGPSGIPIEGEWYTYTFRNAYFGKLDEGTVTVETQQASDIASDYFDKLDEYGTLDDGIPADSELQNTQLPLAFGGVENQYFATFLKPQTPKPEEMRPGAVMTVVEANRSELKKADIAVDLVYEPFEVATGTPVQHSYALFAGPKKAEVLAPYGAEDLGIYRQVGHVPVIGFIFDALWALINPIVAVLSTWVITPLLSLVYSTTASISGWFGGDRGSYGIAIILLTLIVRMGMFPLSRKQAASAKKMQELQPLMVSLREKYKDDREKLAQETFALYRKYGINPLGGCLPVLIQIPIFMTLWRTLNVSVELRQAEFLWIDNLAAPDMLFKLPFELPLLGPYFNLLPVIVIGLMLVQMKLFSPPAASPEQEQQQKIMKFMMVFMMLMFYRVPSGLALYFITSSIWSVSERLLLPKVSTKLQAKGEDEDGRDGRGPSGPDKGEPKAPGPNGGGWLSRKLEELMKEASKETTYRREAIERERPKAQQEQPPASVEAQKPRPKPKKGKSRPGKRR